jgi:TonB family protein
MAESRDKKILRIGLIQNGKIVEERLLRRRETVTIGQSPRNTFVLSSGGLPKSYNLFEIRSNTYHLNFRAGMNGKVSVDNSVMDFRALREQKLARKRGENYTVKLSERSRGKVMLGDVTVLFQFVTPPPPPSTLQLPASLRGGWSQRTDWQFASALLGSFVFQVFSLAFIMSQDYPPPPQGIETLSDRFTEVVFEKKVIKPPPPKVNEEKKDEKKDPDKKEPEKKAEKKPEPKPEPKETPEVKARRKAKELRRMQKEVANKTILKFVGSKGGDNPASILDSLKDGATDVRIAEAFDGANGIMVAKNSDTSRDRRLGSSSGKVAGLDSSDLKGREAGKVSTGKKTERKIKGAVKIKKPSEAFGTGVLDPNSIAKVVGRRKNAIKACYEKQLKKNPKLAGKVKIQFTILGSGRVGDVQVLQDSTGEPAVGACIKRNMKRWKFPKPDGGSVTVAFPFVFQPSG